MPTEPSCAPPAQPSRLRCPLCGAREMGQRGPGLYMGALRLGYLCPDCLKQRPAEAAAGVLRRAAEKQAQADRARHDQPAEDALVRVLERSVDHLTGLASHLERMPSWTEQPIRKDRPAPAGLFPRPAGVLVVDEDPATQSLLLRLLRKAGFQTWQAQAAEQAVEAIRRHHARIDLALLEARTPGGQAAWVIAEMRRHNPRLVCCLMSAEPGEYTAEMLVNVGVSALFEKPFDIAGLLATLRHLLPW